MEDHIIHRSNIIEDVLNHFNISYLDKEHNNQNKQIMLRSYSVYQEGKTVSAEEAIEMFRKEYPDTDRYKIYGLLGNRL